MSPCLAEVVYDEQTEQVHLVLHSGSRGIGNQTAQQHSHKPLETADSVLEDSAFVCCAEVVYDEQTEQVYLMLHSGSRGIGNQTAQHYDREAKQDMQQRGLSAATPGLNYLHIQSPEGAAYLQASCD